MTVGQRQILLKGFHAMVLSIEIRALFFLRSSTRSEGQTTQPPFLRLVCYYLALLISELVAVRGENVVVAASLADILLTSCLLPSFQSCGHQLWASSRSLLTKLLRRYLGDQASQRTVQSLWMIPIQDCLVVDNEAPSNQYSHFHHDSLTVETGRQNQLQLRSIQSLIETGLGIETPLCRKMAAVCVNDSVILELVHSILKTSSCSPLIPIRSGFGSLFSTTLINLLVYCCQVANAPALAIESLSTDLSQGGRTIVCGLGASTHGLKSWIQNILLVLFSLSPPSVSTLCMNEEYSQEARNPLSPLTISTTLPALLVEEKPHQAQFQIFPPIPVLESGRSGRAFCDSIYEAVKIMGVQIEFEEL